MSSRYKSLILMLFALVLLVSCQSGTPSLTPFLPTSTGVPEQPKLTDSPSQPLPSATAVATDMQESLPISRETSIQVQRLGTLIGHTDRVITLAFGPHGELASSSWDGTIRLWDIDSGETIQTFTEEVVRMNGIAISPDGRFLASTSNVWDLLSGEVVHKLDGKNCVDYSPDGSLLAATYSEQSIKIWDVKSWQAVRTLRGHTEPIFSVAFSPDGKLLASSAGGDSDHTTRIWEVESGQELHRLDFGAGDGHDLAFSHDGKYVATGITEYAIFVWDVETGEQVQSLRQRDGIMSVAFSPVNNMLAAGGVEYAAHLWDVESGRKLRALPHEDELMAVAFSPDGSILAAAGYDDVIYLWGILPDTETSNPPR